MPMDDSLSILDVGHGNCAVLRRLDHIIVIDAGQKSALLEFLESTKTTRVDVVLVSHADADHIGGLLGLLTCGKFSFGEIRLNSDALKESKAWDDLLFVLDEMRQAGEVQFSPSLTTGDSGRFNHGDVSVEILAPSGYLAGKGPGGLDRNERKITSNTISAVIKIVKDGNPIALLTGDLDDVGLANIAEGGVDIKASLLVFPHHGGRSGVADPVDFAHALYDLVQPSIVAFSMGRDRFENPRPDIVRALKNRREDIRIMCTQLSKHCAPELPVHMPDHLSDAFSQGRERRKCCAGTMVISFENPAALLPASDLHRAFIAKYAPKALCK